ncbi:MULTISPECIES: hypothetical protein [Aeromonas]|uniref:Phage protein n=1 Tax=Aeromonas bestiarum TaxID=105751 RepID=A0AAW7IFY7_9GAMM|nr:MULTISPECIES: hypothetical protein [Aeromonas]MCE9970031.1 hypothetical protein [Aeromonas salmonicida]MDM5116348.1 hypothetical protein [Aeromonas salmonicida]MDM5142772.1 hypothetical protein [Aeromonas bestiarum]
MGQIKLPKPIYYDDLKNADTGHEMFSYLVLAAAHYQVSMNWDMSYPEMAKAIQGQLQALDLDTAEASAQVEGMYCMMELVALINQKQPGDSQAKQRHVQRGAFKK